MTLIQASIANKGRTVIIIADRLLTNTLVDIPDYEIEGNSPKIFLRKNVVIGFAGEVYDDEIFSLLPPNISDFDKIVKIVSKFVKDTRNSKIEKEVYRVARISAKEFFTNTIRVPKSQPIAPQVPEKVRDDLYDWISDFEFDFSCIVAGFDINENPKIVEITGDGDVLNKTSYGMDSIGVGFVFSNIYFDQHQYDISMPETEGLYFAYIAKKRAEAHAGVGLNTDIFLLKKNGESLEIRNDDALMDEIAKIYEEEKNENRRIKDRLLTKLIENSEGKLK